MFPILAHKTSQNMKLQLLQAYFVLTMPMIVHQRVETRLSKPCKLVEQKFEHWTKFTFAPPQQANLEKKITGIVTYSDLL